MFCLRPIVLWDEKTVLLIQQYRNNNQPYVNISNNKIPFFSHPIRVWDEIIIFSSNHTLNHTYTHNTSDSFSIQYLFLHPISRLGWKKLFFSSTIHKQKSQNKLLIYKNDVFFIQFQLWMKLIPTQRRRTRIMLDLSYLLPSSLIVLYFKPLLLLFLGSFFSSTTSWYTFLIIQLVGWNKFVL